MVSIDLDTVGPDVRHGDRRTLPVGGRHIESLPDLRFDAGGEAIQRDLEDQVLGACAVRILRWYLGGHLLSHGQPLDSLLEAGNDVPRAQDEGQRAPALGGIENGAVIESAGVVNVNGVALLRRGHSMPRYRWGQES